ARARWRRPRARARAATARIPRVPVCAPPAPPSTAPAASSHPACGSPTTTQRGWAFVRPHGPLSRFVLRSVAFRACLRGHVWTRNSRPYPERSGGDREFGGSLAVSLEGRSALQGGLLGNRLRPTAALEDPCPARSLGKDRFRHQP